MAKMKIYPANRLIDTCEPLFFFANQLRSANDLGDFNKLRSDIGQLFDNMEKGARGIGISEDEITKAKFAIVSLIDELILGSPWESKESWAGNPLQLDYFGEATAGVEFFNKLDTVRKGGAAQSDLLEVYYFCLIFGFEGKYKIMGRDKLKGLIDEVTQIIRIKYDKEKEISPSWRRKEEIMDIVKQGIPIWVIIVVSVSLAFFIYLTFSIWLGRDADNIVQELSKLMN